MTLSARQRNCHRSQSSTSLPPLLSLAVLTSRVNPRSSSTNSVVVPSVFPSSRSTTVSLKSWQLATAGDTHLCGEDFDNRDGPLDQRLRHWYHQKSPSKLKREVEKAKRAHCPVNRVPGPRLKVSRTERPLRNAHPRQVRGTQYGSLPPDLETCRAGSQGCQRERGCRRSRPRWWFNSYSQGSATPQGLL